MGHREQDILEHAVHAIAEQAANTNKVIDQAMEAGLAPDHPVSVAAKQVRLELLTVKGPPGTRTYEKNRPSLGPVLLSSLNEPLVRVLPNR